MYSTLLNFPLLVRKPSLSLTLFMRKVEKYLDKYNFSYPFNQLDI